MHRNVILCLVSLILLFPALSMAEINDGLGDSAGKHSGGQPMKSPHSVPMNSMPMSGGDAVPSMGKVVSAINGAGYTYMELEADGKKFWIAGTQIAVKPGQNVEFVENVIMNNFTSKTLNKTFDTIIFASSVKVLP